MKIDCFNYSVEFGISKIMSNKDENMNWTVLFVAVFMPQTPGFYDRKGFFHFIPEMVPEFVVPDMKDFKVQS